VPITGTVELEAGARYPFELVLSAEPGLMGAVDVGIRLPETPDPIGEAVASAAEADVAVVMVGTNDDWETEGVDRTTIDLPGHQDELIRRVVAANPRTVVVVNTGGPVHLPWRHEVPAILQAWFGGQGMVEALADVLIGEREPGGRLPVTLPIREEHGPSHGNFPGSNGVVRYGEGVFIGHRWYQERGLPMAFPFGHGLSYTTFEIGRPRLSSNRLADPSGPDDEDDGGVTVSVEVTNTGDRAGTEVVQCYVAPPVPTDPAAPPRPPLTLQGMAKVALEPQASTEVHVRLPARAFARWHDPDPGWEATVVAKQASLRMFPIPVVDPRPGWVVDPGTHEIVVARSSVDEVARLPLDVTRTIRL
jgi:beta-glucosidase